MKFWYTTVLSITIAVVVVPLSISAQLTISNPYSRYGFGQLSQQGSVKSFGLAGITAPIIDGAVINFGNPASYSYLKQPVFQASVKGSSSTFFDMDGGSTRFRGGGVSEIALAFKKEGGKWALAMGLTPYSSTGYNLGEKKSINDSITAEYSYKGDGGINKLILGLSRNFSIPVDTSTNNVHRLSIGCNINYFFGAINQYRRTSFNNSTYYGSRITSRTSVSDANLDFGILYTVPLQLVNEGKKTIRGKYLIIGTDYSLQSSLNSRYSELGESFYNYSGVEVAVDTSYSYGEIKGTLLMPQKINLGASFLVLGKRGSSLTLSAEYSTQDWKKFASRFDDISNNDPLVRANNIAVAIDYSPADPFKARNFFGKMQYRAGVRSTNTYIALKYTQISQQAVSAGLTLPVLSSRIYGNSFLYLGAEYGKSGTTDQNLLREEFLNLQFGFSFVPFERWFEPTKYD